MNPTHRSQAVLHRIGCSRIGSALLVRLMIATCGAVVLSLVFVAEASAAEAVSDAAESLVLIRKMTGPDAEDIQVTVEAAVAENFSAVSASGDEDAELEKGAETMVSMSAEKKYRAYVAGVVVKGQKGRDLTLTVFSGDTGESVGEVKMFAINMAKLEEKVDSEAGKQLAALLAKTNAASPKEAPEEVKLEVDLGEDDEEETSDEADDDQERPSALDVNAAAGVVNLDLSYNQPIADSFGYVLQQRPSTPLAYRFGGHLYPGAFFTSNALADIGIAANYYQSIAGSISVNGTPFDLVFAEINLGLRGRIRLGESELGIYGGVGQTGAVIEGDNEPFTNAPAATDPGLFPDMNYKYLRFGVDGRTPISGALSLGFGAYLRLPDVRAGVGQLGEPRWFPRASATGVDGQLNLYYELVPGLSIMAGGDARVYSLSMHSSPEDERKSAIAGGAVDRYLGGFLGVDFRL